MDVAVAASYFLIFLQLLTGLVLFRVRLDPRDRFAIQIFASLFFLNAAATVLLTLPRDTAIWLRSDQDLLTRLVRALDTPTGPFLFAFLAARSTRAWGPRLAWAWLACGVLLGLAEFPFHAFMAENDVFVRALPFYAALAAASWLLARGRPFERWIGLALLSRAVYWSTAGVATVLLEGLGAKWVVQVNYVALLALFVVTIASIVRFVRVRDEPSLATTLVVLAIGPLAVALETAVRSTLAADDPFWYGSISVFNLLTVALVRPIVTMVGLRRAWLLPVAGRSALAAGIGAIAALVVGPLRGTARGRGRRTEEARRVLLVGAAPPGALRIGPGALAHGVRGRSDALVRARDAREHDRPRLLSHARRDGRPSHSRTRDG